MVVSQSGLQKWIGVGKYPGREFSASVRQPHGIGRTLFFSFLGFIISDGWVWTAVVPQQDGQDPKKEMAWSMIRVWRLASSIWHQNTRIAVRLREEPTGSE